MSDEQIAGYVVAVLGGVAAGILLHNNHVAGHTDRRMSASRSFWYIAQLGLLYYVGQLGAAIALGLAPWSIIFLLTLWLTFSAAAAIAVYALEHRRRQITGGKP